MMAQALPCVNYFFSGARFTLRVFEAASRAEWFVEVVVEENRLWLWLRSVLGFVVGSHGFDLLRWRFASALQAAPQYFFTSHVFLVVVSIG
jgi:hypothetical protein